MIARNIIAIMCRVAVGAEISGTFVHAPLFNGNECFIIIRVSCTNLTVHKGSRIPEPDGLILQQVCGVESLLQVSNTRAVTFN